MTNKFVIYFVTGKIRALNGNLPIIRLKRLETLQSPVFTSPQTPHEINNYFLNPNKNRPKNAYTCKTCGASYALKVHLQTHKKDDCGRIHKCSICGRSYKEKSNLRRHMRSVFCIP